MIGDDKDGVYGGGESSRETEITNHWFQHFPEESLLLPLHIVLLYWKSGESSLAFRITTTKIVG